MRSAESRTARHRFVSGALTLALLAGCAGEATRPSPGPRAVPPADVLAVPDAVPRIEPRSRSGNPPFYDVFGQRYFVLPTSEGYSERGVASWYGPGFHGQRTASGEPYDMYSMTAAHKTLPLPAYARVTNLRNGRSVVVRVNDRGPFKDDRIIDLSYTAAARLDMLRDGTALVQVEALVPGSRASAPPAVVAPEKLVVQAGAFSDPANAERLVARLRTGGFDRAYVQHDNVGGRTLYRVRVGPIATVAQFDRAVAQLRSMGIQDAHLALN